MDDTVAMHLAPPALDLVLRSERDLDRCRGGMYDVSHHRIVAR
jgi:hypothetical protein